MAFYKNQVYYNRLKPTENTVSVFQCLFASISSHATGGAISVPSMKFISLDITDCIFDSCSVLPSKDIYSKAGGAIYSTSQEYINITKSCFSECHAPWAEVIFYDTKKYDFSNLYFDLGITENSFIDKYIWDESIHSLSLCNISNLDTKSSFKIYFNYNYFVNSSIHPGYIYAATNSYCKIPFSKIH